MTRRARVTLLALVLGFILLVVLGTATGVFQSGYRGSLRIVPTAFLSFVGLMAISAALGLTVALLFSPAPPKGSAPSLEQLVAMGMLASIRVTGPLMLQSELKHKHGLEVGLPLCRLLAVDVFGEFLGDPDDVVNKPLIAMRLEDIAVIMSEATRGTLSDHLARAHATVLMRMRAHGLKVRETPAA
jgi:hypothetical protein